MIKPAVCSATFRDTPPEKLQRDPKTLLELINLKKHE